MEIRGITANIGTSSNFPSYILSHLVTAVESSGMLKIFSLRNPYSGIQIQSYLYKKTIFFFIYAFSHYDHSNSVYFNFIAIPLCICVDSFQIIVLHIGYITADTLLNCKRSNCFISNES